MTNAVVLSAERSVATGTAYTTPFEIQVESSGGECVRIEVLSTTPTGRDTVMHLVSPNLTTWQDDDSGAGLYSRIQANTVEPGRYTLVVGLYAPAVFNSNTFVDLTYGRYPIGNPNCTEATVPLETSPLALPSAKKIVR